MARKHRKHRHKNISGLQSKTKPKARSWLYIIVSIALLLGVGFFVTTKKEALARIDPVTFCDTAELPQVTAVIFDGSDPVDAVQRELILARLLQSVARLPERARIDVYYSSPQQNSLIKPVFTKCNPGPAGSKLTSDAKADAKRFETEFLGALEKAFANALSQNPAQTSPILESIRAAGAKSFARIPDDTPRQVIIISDMLQNSDLLSHYKNITSFSEFQNSPSIAKALSRLGTPGNLAKVEVLYIIRPETRKFQGAAHQSWWEDFFRASEAYVIMETF